MRTILGTVLACSLLLGPASAEDSRPDLKSPKPDNFGPIRVLLHIAGSPRLIDYSDVCKILCSDPGQITFETNDGYVVTHQGAFTVIQQRATISSPASNPRGPRFYDPK
jgi:hypothetical protein